MPSIWFGLSFFIRDIACNLILSLSYYLLISTFFCASNSLVTVSHAVLLLNFWPLFTNPFHNSLFIQRFPTIKISSFCSSESSLNSSLIQNLNWTLVFNMDSLSATDEEETSNRLIVSETSAWVFLHNTNIIEVFNKGKNRIKPTPNKKNLTQGMPDYLWKHNL